MSAGARRGKPAPDRMLKLVRRARAEKRKEVRIPAGGGGVGHLPSSKMSRMAAAWIECPALDGWLPQSAPGRVPGEGPRTVARGRRRDVPGGMKSPQGTNSSRAEKRAPDLAVEEKRAAISGRPGGT